LSSKIRVVVDGVIHDFESKVRLRVINLAERDNLLIVQDVANPSDVQDLAVFRKWDYWEKVEE